MSTFKDEIIEKLKREVLNELIDEFRSGAFLAECKGALRQQVREEVQDEIDQEDADRSRSEIAEQIYIQESEEIKIKVRKEIRDEYATISYFAEQTLEEHKRKILGEIDASIQAMKAEPLGQLSDRLKKFVDDELKPKWKIELEAILREDLAKQLLNGSPPSSLLH
jgi:hypothetical protein